MRNQLRVLIAFGMLLASPRARAEGPAILDPRGTPCGCAPGEPAVGGSSLADGSAALVSESPAGLLTFHDWLHQQLPFRHTHPDDPARHIGLGIPLKGTSWRNRPLYMGWSIGGLIGEDLIDGRVEQGNRVLGAYRLGWDFDHYWGTEFRVAFAEQEAIDLLDPNTSSTAQEAFGDASLLYYPWGDAQWRPYAQVGLGFASFRFTDARQNRYNEILFEMPLGVGVKYQTRPWLAWRLDATDNLAISAAGLSTMHNVSLTAGLEVRFGGSRRSYYPWYPGGQLW